MNTPKITFVTLALFCLGLVSLVPVSAQAPDFKSGASTNIGIPVDFNVLAERIGTIYAIQENDDNHVVWKLTGTTGDWAFAFADGRIVVASTVDLDLTTTDTLTSELGDIINMLNLVGGVISDEAKANALESATYYAREPDIYHRLKYNFEDDISLTLVVPECTVKNARLSISGEDEGNHHSSDHGQIYYLDGQKISECEKCSELWLSVPCSVSSTDITDKIPTGSHKISSWGIGNKHTMILEVITSTTPPRKFVMYGPKYLPWINETSESLDLQALDEIIYR